jgi:ABC-2 type transport system permease protein
MGKLLSTFQKELILLMRDRTGIVLLFIMPAILVLIICLVQEKVLNPTTQVLIVDNDRGIIGQVISKGVAKSDNLKVVMGSDIGTTTGAEAKQAVNRGEYQFSIVIPQGCSKFSMEKARQFIDFVTGGHNPNINTPAKENEPTKRNEDADAPDKGSEKSITIYFDPSVQGGFRAAVLTAVSKVLVCMEYQIKLEHVLSLLPPDKNNRDKNNRDQNSRVQNNRAVETKIEESSPWFGISELWATEFGFITMPTSVQQNVPAWALFGIFFICVPLSGSLIKERDNKIVDRLNTMPVSRGILMFGKILAYVLVCLVQFFMIFLIGKFVLPLFGLPAFSTGNQLPAVTLIVLAAAMAATGYGVLIGSVTRTFEQAIVLGPTSIVIAAALGGVMVPVYLMPEPMQVISNISPLAWALDAFYDIFLRGKQLEAVVPKAVWLFSFSAITLAIAQVAMKFKR